MTTTNNNRQSLIIGAAWTRSKTSEKGTFNFRRLALTGKRPEDEFEVLLRNKSDGAVNSLSEVNVIMVDNGVKKTDKHPDFILKAFTGVDNETVNIGVAWSKTKENDRGPYSFDSISLSGQREQDEVEIILREKASNTELALSATPVIMVPNNNRKTDKHPDFLIKAFYE